MKEIITIIVHGQVLTAPKRSGSSSRCSTSDIISVWEGERERSRRRRRIINNL